MPKSKNKKTNQVKFKVKKRDGRIVDFDKERITTSIFKAADSVGGDDRKRAEEVANEAVKRLNEKYANRDTVKTTEIAEVVKDTLIDMGHGKTSVAFDLFLQLRNQIKNIKSLIDADSLIKDYIDMEDWRIKENSNMSYSWQGLNNHISSSVQANYWLHSIFDKDISNAHINGDIHLHDLGMLATYCCGWSLEDLLIKGFTGVPGKISCAPPKHFRTALGQIVNYLYTLQHEAAGAQAFSSFDTYLAPFIRYDELSYDEVKQAMQEFLFNMNVPTRVGCQTPFTNITMDLKPHGMLANESVIIGGKPQKDVYGDFQEEMDMINKAFCEVMLEGDAQGRIFSFPIPTYNLTKDFEWENPKYDKLWEMTAKYGIPYFSNFINSDMSPDDARSMCPLAGEEKVLIRSSRGRGLEYSSIRNIYEGNSKKDVYEIYSDGKFVKGKFNKFENQKMLKVTLANNHVIKMSEKHLNFVSTNSKSNIKEITGSDLTEEMYLPYSLNIFEGKGGTKELGYFVGAYAGDGSFDGNSTTVFSLCIDQKDEVVKRLINISEKYFGANYSITEYEDTKLLTLKIHSKAAVGLCKDYVEGKERVKRYTARVFDCSKDFRLGVIEGHYATDGGNRNRIYTSSKRMVETLNMLAASLGTTTAIYEDTREGRLGKEANYAVLIYKLDRDKYGDFWFKKGDKLWVKIKNIEKLPNKTAYCFEVLNNDPIFTVGTTGILTHNCRLRLDNRELRKRGGGLFGANPLTGSIGVVTINMARIGYLAKDEKEYFEMLDKWMDVAKRALMARREFVEEYMEKGLYPYSKFYLADIAERFGEYFKNHFNTIGLLGLNESIVNFTDEKENIASEKGREFGLKVLTHMRERLMDYQIETNQLFNLEATPGEGTTYRFAKSDKKKFGDDIITAADLGVTHSKDPYYTNSSQLPVGYTDDVWEALDLQDDFQTKYTGGTVLHIFLGEKMPSVESTRTFVKKVAENYTLPYFSITPTFSICPKHGYISGEHQFCPKCDAELGYQEGMEFVIKD
ncbi:MAG: Anaerobic ribonucleoside-triphosphate reductase [candidate division WS6 bacterium 34_10]|uniref:Anaerobic ribonucleoside-triphosphate reductase n=1 Tax=candidate division WS6 bacterium 34_10 TaxID=1641389 RepID=A0A117M0H0_9BACT|nr:MAG: Anaerobic ribonucleoside-triphosphate reductase [candidate division WS6 bacterium 34_10]